VSQKYVRKVSFRKIFHLKKCPILLCKETEKPLLFGRKFHMQMLSLKYLLEDTTKITNNLEKPSSS